MMGGEGMGGLGELMGGEDDGSGMRRKSVS